MKKKTLSFLIVIIMLVINLLSAACGLPYYYDPESGRHLPGASFTPGNSVSPGGPLTPPPASATPMPTQTPTISTPTPKFTPTPTPTPTPAPTFVPPGEEDINIVTDYIFTVFDLSNPGDVIFFGLSDAVTNVSSIQIDNFPKISNANEYSYDSGAGTLTIWADAMNTFVTENNLHIIGSSRHVKINNAWIDTMLYIADKVIYDAESLQTINGNNINNRIQDATALKKFYVLGADIDCSGISNFEPIGFKKADINDTYPIIELRGKFPNMPFMGTFEGAGYTISNMRINTNECEDVRHRNISGPLYGGNDGSLMGFFAYTEGAKIRNFKMANSYVEGSLIIGTIIGSADKGTEISNIYIDNDSEVHGTYKIMDWNCIAAGFAGIVGANTRIVNCISEAKVYLNGNLNNQDGWIRAFAGKTWGSIINCFARSDPAAIGIVLDWWPGAEDSASPPIGDEFSYRGFPILDEITGAVKQKDGFISLYNTFDGFTYLHFDFEYDGGLNIKPETRKITGYVFNCFMKTENELKDAALYDGYSDGGDIEIPGYDTRIWHIEEGRVPYLYFTINYRYVPLK